MLCAQWLGVCRNDQWLCRPIHSSLDVCTSPTIALMGLRASHWVLGCSCKVLHLQLVQVSAMWHQEGHWACL